MPRAGSRAALVLAGVASLAALAPSPALAVPFHVAGAASTLVVRATRGGLLSALAHNHQLTPARWQATVDFDPERRRDLTVEFVVDAATLHEHDPRLSRSARAVVDRETAGPDVLDAERYPTIRFRGAAATVERSAPGVLEGVLRGTLSLHGATRPLEIPFRARLEGPGYRASGAVRFRQTAFGMKPYSTAMGTIGVEDELLVEFDLVLVPGASGWAASAR